MAITAETRTAIIQLVVTAYDAAPGTTLLTELVAIVDGGGSLADVATNLTTRTEWTSKYPSFQTSGEFGAEWLGALVPEASADSLAAGVVVVEGLVAGGSTFAEIIIAAQGFLAALPTTDVAFGTSAANFANKVTVATYQTISLEQAGAGSLSGVTSDVATVASVNAAAAAVVNAVASTTSALTTGLDTGAAFTAGSGNDTFVGVDNNLATTGTLTSGDNLVGGEGSDTLSIVASGTAAAPLVSTSSIENLAISNNSGSGYTLNTSLMTGLTDLKVTGGAQNTTVTASQANLDITASTTNNNITATSAVPSAGAADTIAINLTAVGRTGNPTILSDGIETINVALNTSASGSSIAAALSTVTIDSNQLETLNITGSQAANLTAVLQGATAFQQVGTVDASAATGNVRLSVTPGASSDRKTLISMGAGDDYLTIGALDKDFTITGGEGSDTLVATATAPSTTLAAANYVGVGVSGFEVISASGAGAVDFRSLANNTTFISTTGAGTYSKAGATIADSFLTATSGALTLTRATDTAADALNIHLQSATAATVSASVVNEETITIAAAGSGSGITHNMGLTVTDATKLNVIGSNGLNITSLVGETNLATIDAGTSTGSVLTVNASGSTKALTVTGSAGNEASLGATVNTITTGTGADIVAGGAYADTLTTGTGNDSVTGGAGNDNITSGGGNDTVVAGAGNDTISGGTGSDSLSGGDGNDNIDAGSGADTVDAGAGTDKIVVTLSDSTNVDGGAGTDRVSASTAAVTSTSAATVTAQYIAVADSVKPTLTGVESLHVRVDADASGTALANQVNLDLTNASSLTTLFMDTDDTTQDSFMKVTNFAGTAATIYGGTSFGSGAEAENIIFDGTGQTASTVNLQAFEQTSNGTFAVTGIQGLTIAADSTSQLTGSADQDNALGVVTANGSTAVTITSSGSAALNAAALTIASVSATGANSISLTTGTFDDVEITADITGGTAVETASIAVGTDSQLTMAQLDLSTSALSSATINVGAGGTITNSNANTTIITAEAMDVIATSIADLNVTLGAGANASLLLNGAMTDFDASIGSSGLLVLEDSLGAAAAASNFTFTGRGDLDSDEVGTGLTTTANSFVLAGSTVTFNSSGLSTDSDTIAITAAAVTTSANITTGLGADTLTGSAGNDTLKGNNAADQYIGGDGVDTLNLAETVSAADTVVINSVVGTSSDSISVTVTGNNNNKGEDTVSGYTHGTDVIRITSSVQGAFVHATDTQIGLANAGVAATGVAGDYAITAGLVDLDNDGTYTGVDDVVINFSSPSAALTETNFEASLSYFSTLTTGGIAFTSGGQADSITGGAGADTITTAGGADTVDAGAAADIIDVGTGLDVVQLSTGDAVLSIAGVNNGGTIAGFDVITGLAAGQAAVVSETLDVAGTASIPGNGAVDGTNSTLKIGNVVVKSHSVTSGIATFDDAGTYQGGGVVGVTTDAHVAAVVQYLQLNDLGNGGATVAFIGTGGATFVYTQGDNGGTNGLDTLVKLVGVAADSLKTTNAVGANDLFIS